MTGRSARTYVVTVDGALLGLERVLGLLRRRQVDVCWLSIHTGERAGRWRLLLRIDSANHQQVRRQLDRLIEVIAHTDIGEETRDDAA